MAELRALLTAFADGELDDAERRRVEALLDADEGARDALRAIYRQQLQLAELLAPPRADADDADDAAHAATDMPAAAGEGLAATTPRRRGGRQPQSGAERRPAPCRGRGGSDLGTASRRRGAPVGTGTARRTRHWRNPLALAIVIAALLLVGAFAIFSLQAKPAVGPGPTVAEVPGVPTATPSDRADLPERRADDGTWQPVAAGAGLVADAELVLRWQDGSTATLSVGTLTVFAPDAGKLLTLERGSLTVTATSQPAGRPWRVRTPHVAVEVVGTTFTVTVDPERSRVAVAEGRVQVRSGDAEQLMVAGEAGFAGSPLRLPIVMDSWVDPQQPAARPGAEAELRLAAADAGRAYLAATVPADWDGVQASLHLDLDGGVADGERLQAAVIMGTPWDNGEGNLCAHHDHLPARPGWQTVVVADGAIDLGAQALRAGTCTVVLISPDGELVLRSREGGAQRHLALRGLTAGTAP